jgi:hypothetical protein
LSATSVCLKGANNGSGHNLFDHLVGAGDQSARNGDTERLGSLEVDDKLESGRLLDRVSFGLQY